MGKIRTHRDLEVYQMAFELAMTIYDLTTSFPKEEKYSLVDQIRRSSRSVCSNTAEAFRKRRYPAAFIAKLSDSEAEAAETQVWSEFALKCKYISDETFQGLFEKYDILLRKLVTMSQQPEKWKP